MENEIKSIASIHFERKLCTIILCRCISDPLNLQAFLETAFFKNNILLFSYYVISLSS